MEPSRRVVTQLRKVWSEGESTAIEEVMQAQ
jgi:hypothetical protein